ncbi:MAG: Tyrosine recombinase XerC [Alphaproteobacteria bacterium MarineAlpha6_Bin4]|nr:MAG: Tyrosine recombinase XerC [Alphaproteobacteria bacterium MarineAlpha6_Bin3]PPR38254.1 MAG: Tyrosine recombinase XerC [Alphaproteobacteria bacterium MarineAlpha6_Bin4]|tara:strand:+ start:4496 stop:5419 length:924 start_codon:yes stop_codon:yes gene_type:complete
MTQEINYFIQTLNSEIGVHKNTIISYKYDINQFHNFINKKKKNFKSVNKEIMLDFLDSLKLKNLKNKTKTRKIYALKRFYKFLMSEKIIEKNPMEKIDIPKSEDTLSITLTSDQIEKIIKFVSKKNSNYIDIRSNLIIELLYSTGIRVSELISIKTNNVDLDKKSILIDPPEKGKSRKERVVFFGDQTKRVIEKYLEFRKIYFKNKDTPWLFPSSNTNEFLTRRRVLQIMHNLADEINIDKDLMHPHSFRHAFGNHLLNSGADIRVVQKLLGHSSIITTQKYTEHRDKLIETIENFHPLNKNNENIV